mmetsp:Transcript_10773/g.13472  ORF Transcript_10773/g.13472 Transcript_10773/m.13472 type:complete len:115 (-) Transcript_10773:151-495(-)
MQKAQAEVDQMNYYHNLREQKEVEGEEKRKQSERDLDSKNYESGPRIQCEYSNINSKLIIMGSSTPLQGVAAVVDLVGSYGELVAVRCSNRHAEIEFLNADDAQKAAKMLNRRD